MKNFKFLAMMMFFASGIFFQSCDPNIDEPKGIYDGGVFISNEGTFGQGNGSVSYYRFQGDSVINNIFEKANDRILGDVVQSLSIFNNKAYICVNASNKIEIAWQSNFEEVGVIENLPVVRYFIGLNAEKAYATCWGDGGQVKVLDLLSNQVSKSIDVGNGPEKMVLANNKLYVVNSGGFGEDNTLSVIDITTDELINTITFDAYNPNSLVTDGNNIWALCKGKSIYDQNWQVIDHTPSKIYQINSTNDEIVNSAILFPDQHPFVLQISPDFQTLYVGAGFGFEGIYKVNAGSLIIDSNPIISKYFYGFNVYSNGEIFATEAPSFTDNGTLYRYKPDGTLMNQYTVGIGPNGADFKLQK